MRHWALLPFWPSEPVSATRLSQSLGERVVADIRKAVFDRVIGMSPEFYERIMTGEVLSRITTDTTLIQSVIGSSVSIALRNMLMFVGGLVLMLLTSAKLTGLVLLLIPVVVVPILVLGPALARDQPRKSGLDRGLVGKRGRGAGGRADGAGLHP